MRNKILQNWRRQVVAPLLAAVLLAVGLVLPMTQVQAQSLGNPKVIPPNSWPYGLTYSQWSARWWQYVLSTPEPDNPLLHDDKCTVGQSGPVWFLTGKIAFESGSPFIVTRYCTVPTGKALFFPIANTWGDNLGVDPPFTTQELRDLVKVLQDTVTSMSCEVDGVPIQGLTNSSPYRVISPVFDYNLPDNNLFTAFGYNFPAQTVQGAVADGVYVMLAPLSAGQHTIHFTASFDYGFAFDVTYYLTVQ